MSRISSLSRRLGARKGPPQLRAALRSLGPGTIALDCGAHIGRYTDLMAARGALVYAFEPNPYAFEALRSRFAAVPNVVCRQQAVSDRDGTARLFLHERAEEDQVAWSIGSSLFGSKLNVREDTAVTVETVDLDGFIAALDRPVAVLKLDVEGAEIAILGRLLASGRLKAIEHVLVEMHDGRIPSLAEAGAELRERLARAYLQHVWLDWE